MIFTSNNQTSKHPSDLKTNMSSEEPPPSYSPQANTTDSSPVESGSPRAPTFKTKPTNFLALDSAHNSIRGEFVVDPFMRIPPAMLPPLAEGETEDDRKNLSLKSVSGSVHADVWLLGPSGERPTGTNKPRRTTVALTSTHGSVRARVHTVDGAAPFSLTASSAHGTVRLAIPRSFQGLLSLSTCHGSISVSDAIVERATQLSPLDTTRRYFVGDFRLLGEDEWGGDQVEVDATHGFIGVQYEDEAAESRRRSLGLFGWLFGL